MAENNEALCGWHVVRARLNNVRRWLS